MTYPKRIKRHFSENWYGLQTDYYAWRRGDFTFGEFLRGRRDDPLAPTPLSVRAQELASDPNRPVFKANPDHLFPFQQRWERPDVNPFPQFSFFSLRKRR